MSSLNRFAVFSDTKINHGVCIEPRPSALNVALPASAAELGRRVPAIDRYLVARRRLCSTPLTTRRAAPVDRWDRRTDGQTDGRMLDRYIDPAPHTMRAASIKMDRHTTVINHEKV